MMYTSYDVYESHRFFLFLQELWQRVLQTEWGGMNDVFFNLDSVHYTFASSHCYA